jgi:hypothetical protein
MDQAGKHLVAVVGVAVVAVDLLVQQVQQEQQELPGQPAQLVLPAPQEIQAQRELRE